ncbi:hypothetical protein OSB04_019087 [Centaurea solstitialis]|uniref:CCHC-type domain-containing protein n=1 Tax=Centaurea solstitialis TaxID=347529 RepID=A0AA38WDW4_9ASTR|nr:hypothetical protein OSB04_019087 [Centaurea solstitialis]
MANTVTNTNNLSLRSILEKDKLTGPNFLDWERNLQIVLRHERKWYVLEEPLGEAPPANASTAIRNAYQKRSDDLLDVGCLMLATMSPELQTGLMNTNAYDMIRQLRDMFQTAHVMKMKRLLDHLERLGHPVPLQLATDTILNSLSDDYKQFVMNFNMNNMEKSIAELHSMLKTAEQSMGTGTKTKDVLMVRDGGVKKKRGQRNTSKGKDQVQVSQSVPKAVDNRKGKGKGKKVKVNKAKAENRCFTCHEVGHWRHNCPKRHETDDVDNISIYKTSKFKVLELGFDKNPVEIFIYTATKESCGVDFTYFKKLGVIPVSPRFRQYATSDVDQKLHGYSIEQRISDVIRRLRLLHGFSHDWKSDSHEHNLEYSELTVSMLILKIEISVLRVPFVREAFRGLIQLEGIPFGRLRVDLSQAIQIYLDCLRIDPPMNDQRIAPLAELKPEKLKTELKVTRKVRFPSVERKTRKVRFPSEESVIRKASELEIPSSVSAPKLFKAFLDFRNLAPIVEPETFKAFEVIKGDGGVGTVQQTTFVDGSKTKLRVDDIDHNNLSLGSTILEGGEWMQNLESVTYHTKFVSDTANQGSTYKVSSVYKCKDPAKFTQENAKFADEYTKKTFKAIEAYIIANPNAY